MRVKGVGEERGAGTNHEGKGVGEKGAGTNHEGKGREK